MPIRDDQILGTGTLAAALRYHIKDCPPDFLWCAWDTPIKPDGKPDSEWVIGQLKLRLKDTEARMVVVCSQLPVGTCRKLSQEEGHAFVSYPENVRAAHAVEDFANQSRIVLGSFYVSDARRVGVVLEPFTKRFIFTNFETAEMVKHGLNGFLATSIAYARELSALAVKHKANPEVLAEAIMADPRIGDRAYLKPAGEMGAHLTREVHNLMDLGGGGLIRAVAEHA